jgi:hypothetical protein
MQCCHNASRLRNCSGLHILLLFLRLGGKVLVMLPLLRIPSNSVRDLPEV